MRSKRSGTMWMVLTVILLFAWGCQQGPTSGGKAPGVEQAVSDAVVAYIYGYPLVTMDMTRKMLTNVATPGASRAPMGQLIKLRQYPAVDDHAVTAPNADTLYTMVWLDVSKEPWVFAIPDMGDRRPVLPDADAGCLDGCVPGAGQEDHRR